MVCDCNYLFEFKYNYCKRIKPSKRPVVQNGISSRLKYRIPTTLPRRFDILSPGASELTTECMQRYIETRNFDKT